ncbi:MAG: DNA mismatch repair protein MutS [Bacteroidales bacterium]|nr:DNA mismatch repair protein MutS [Bacteroidales bacterium]
MNREEILKQMGAQKSAVYSQYEEKAEKVAGEIRHCEKKGRWLVAAQLSAFLLVVLSIAIYATYYAEMVIVALGILFVLAYLAARRMDVANGDKWERLKAVRAVYLNEMAYLKDDFTAFRDGKNYIDPHHAFSFDMDVFGEQSLFQRINRTVTSGGSDLLAGQLSRTATKTRQEIESQREAIHELALDESLRTAFMAVGQLRGDLIDTDKVVEVVEKAKSLSLPSFASSSGAMAVAVVSVVGFLSFFVAALVDVVPSGVPFQWGLLQLFLMVILCARPLGSINKTVGAVSKQMGMYVSLMEMISEGHFSAKDNVEMLSRLSSADGNALRSFKELKRFMDSLDRTGNPLYRMLCNAFFLNDFFLVRRFAEWKSCYMPRMIEWIDTVSRFDALVSMATFRYNEPCAKGAEIVDADEVVYCAEGISHPFLGSKAVPNDFTLTDSHYYIVTGANMAGKSTFLRSLGVNYILAMCGMPVFASRLRVSVFSLFSSMRTSDDLAHGISYFNAELLRLKQLIATCRENRHTLIILDEILKGTNSADKLSGSRMFLESISRLPATGIIATHDLELSKMSDEHPARFHNYCFEIALTDHVTYSYKITPGVARNQNATYLLRGLLRMECISSVKSAK